MRPRILLIDDDLDVLALLSAILGGTYGCDTAVGGAEGLLALQRARYDLVLLDLTMPDVDGEDVMCRMSARDDRTPVIIVSGDCDAALRARRLGAVGAVGKPFDPAKLGAVVARALGAQDARAVA